MRFRSLLVLEFSYDKLLTGSLRIALRFLSSFSDPAPLMLAPKAALEQEAAMRAAMAEVYFMV